MSYERRIPVLAASRSAGLVGMLSLEEALTRSRGTQENGQEGLLPSQGW